MYQALYRKWRPKAFEDVVSQPHITTTLKNQIAAGKTAHAYLFTGSRGTGKTTCARIFAKAVNCLHPVNGDPCLECEICRSCENGSAADIIEIDAASNARVDDIRELREGVAYTPEICRYKVYIIDEVHMLSPGAFNALLKTMEEPPEHVKFILATTEVHKVPATIVSRCQHFDFRRIRTADIVSRLSYIAAQEDLVLHDDAAALIAGLSDGGMRDALSLLDQCLAYSDEITVDTVSEAAGIAGRGYLFDILDAVCAKDAGKAIRIIDDLYAGSKDLAVLCSELITQMRNVMILKSSRSSGGGAELIACLPEEAERLSALAAKMDMDTVLNSISLLQKCSEKFSRSTNKCVDLEMCAVRLCGDNTSSEKENTGRSVSDQRQINMLLDRINRLEKELSAYSAGAQSGDNGGRNDPEDTSQIKQKPAPPLKKFDPNNFTPLNEWQDILEIVRERSPALAPFLANSMACIEGDVFNVVVNSDFLLKKFKASDDKSMLKKIVNDYYGKDFGFMLYASKTVDIRDQDNPINELIRRAKDADIEVEIKK